MGVDYGAFIAYGQRVTLNAGTTVDDLETWLTRPGNKPFGLAYVEWGSLGWTGEGGYIVGDRACTRAVSIDDGAAELLQIANPPQDVGSRIMCAIGVGHAPFTADGPVAWWFGVHVY